MCYRRKAPLVAEPPGVLRRSLLVVVATLATPTPPETAPLTPAFQPAPTAPAATAKVKARTYIHVIHLLPGSSPPRIHILSMCRHKVP
jgi:hypothetical protein